jgi:hypothetical protein
LLLYQEEASWAKKQLADMMVKLGDRNASVTAVAGSKSAHVKTASAMKSSIATQKKSIVSKPEESTEEEEEEEEEEEDSQEYSEDFEVSKLNLSTSNPHPDNKAFIQNHGHDESSKQPSPVARPVYSSIDPTFEEKRRNRLRQQAEGLHATDHASADCNYNRDYGYASMPVHPLTTSGDPFAESIARSFLASQVMEHHSVQDCM